MRRIKHFLLLLAGLMVIFSAVGVHATWDFSHEVMQDRDATLAFDMLMPPPVEWEDKEILPAEHARLLEIFIREINNPDSIIHGHIEDRNSGLFGTGWFSKGTLGSRDEEHGQALLNLFSCENSGFVLDFKMNQNGSGYSSLTMYTTEVDLDKLKSGDTVSPVYKTTLTFNTTTQKWEINESFKGKAPFSYYDEEGVLWFWEDIPSFNTDRWTATK